MKQLATLKLRPNRDKTKSTFYLHWYEKGKLIRRSLGHCNARRAEKQRRLKEVEIGPFRKIKSGGQKQKLSTVVLNYLKARKTKIESSTLELTLLAFDYLIEAVGDIKLCEFEPALAEQFQSWCIDSGRNGTTANIYVKTISPVFSWAIMQKWILESPFEKLTLYRRPKKKRIRIYEPDEFAAMLRNCPDDRWTARMFLAKTAGLRRGEALNLTRDDVDFRNGVIYIQEKKETGRTWRWKPKDKDERELPLVTELAEVLKRLIKKIPAGQPYIMLRPKRYQDLIVLKDSGKLIDRIRRTPDARFNEYIKPILKAAKVIGTYHDLRRTCITEWLENGLQPHEVRELAGHSDVRTTMKYYVATRKNLLDKARRASSKVLENVA